MGEREQNFMTKERKQEIRQESEKFLGIKSPLLGLACIPVLVAFINELTEPEEIGERIERKGETPDIIALERERLSWSLATFTEATALSSMLKLKSEADEIIDDIENEVRRPEEYADALMCLFDSAGRQNIFPEEIFKAFAEKLEKNKKRLWKKNPDNSYSHIKSTVCEGLCGAAVCRELGCQNLPF